MWCVWAWSGDVVCDLHVRLPGREGPSAYNHGCACARSRCCPPLRCSPLQPNRELYEPPQQTDAHISDIPAGNEKGKDGRKIHIRCCSLEVKGCRFIVVLCGKKSRKKKVSKWRITGNRCGRDKNRQTLAQWLRKQTNILTFQRRAYGYVFFLLCDNSKEDFVLT